MRVPYVVGRWVRGVAHYDRDRLIDHLLGAPQPNHWLIGTRRVGKTSLLRQLELVAGGDFVPLYWDLQGSESPDDLGSELSYAIDTARERFTEIGVSPDSLAGQDAAVALRLLAADVDRREHRLLLLVDEAEVLVRVARQDPEWVNHLLDVMAGSQIRAVIASTKWLAAIDDVCGDRTGRALFRHFHARFLGGLDDAPARALVRQEQSDYAVLAEDGTVDDVIIHSNGHPYLVQFLCQRLFEVNETGQGALRPVQDHDLEPDQLLGAMFANDIRYLTQSEQRIILSVAKHKVAKQREIEADLDGLCPEDVALYLYGLDRLGLLRRVFGQWAIGNEFLQRWLSSEGGALTDMAGSGSAESTHRLLIEAVRRSDMLYCSGLLEQAEAELRELEEGDLSMIGKEMRLKLERSATLRRHISRLKREIGYIAASSSI